MNIDNILALYNNSSGVIRLGRDKTIQPKRYLETNAVELVISRVYPQETGIWYDIYEMLKRGIISVFWYGTNLTLEEFLMYTDPSGGGGDGPTFEKSHLNFIDAGDSSLFEHPTNPVVFTVSVEQTENMFYGGEASDAEFDQEDVNKTDVSKDIRLEPQSGVLGVVNHWKFDEGGGQEVYDSAIESFNGTSGYDNPLSWAPGHLNLAMSFNGGNQYVELKQGVADFKSNQTFSFDFWLLSTVGVGVLGLFSKLDTDLGRGYAAVINNSMLMVHIGDGGGGAIEVDAPTAIADSVWHYVAITYDGSGVAAGCNIYIDNVAQVLNVTQDNLGGDIDTWYPFQIGRIFMGGGGPGELMFDGLLDDFIVYNQELDAAGVSYRWNAGSGTDIPAVYDDTQMWWLTTNAMSQINTFLWGGITFLRPRVSASSSTGVRMYLSINDRVTWLWWDSGNETWMYEPDLSEISTKGNTVDEIMNMTADNWQMMFVPGTLDLAIAIGTTVAEVTPMVKGVTFYLPNGRVVIVDGFQLEEVDDEHSRMRNMSDDPMVNVVISMVCEQT